MSKSQEQYEKSEKLIKEGKYKEALNFLDVLILKDQKNIKYNMASGLCYQKLQNFKKAEEFYLYCFEKFPQQVQILRALYLLYKDDLKNNEQAQKYIEQIVTILKQTDKSKALDMQVELCLMLDRNQERQKLEVQFQDILLNGSANNCVRVAHIYIPLSLKLKLLDPTQPMTNNIIVQLSKKLHNQLITFSFLEETMMIVMDKLREVNKINRDHIVSSEYYISTLQWLECFPQSCVLLHEVLKYVHCFLDTKLKFILEQCILLLVQNEYLDLGLFNEVKLYQQYTLQDQYQITARRAKVLISFVRHFASQFLLNQGTHYQKAVDILVQSKQIDLIEFDTQLQFLEIPLQVLQLFKSGQKDNQQRANQLLLEFKKTMVQLGKMHYDCALLEEVGANLGYEVLVDPLELMEMKNLLKVRIKNKAFSLETYEKYFDYQIKLVALIRHYDEEIPMQNIFDKILSDDPNNVKIQVQQLWLKFSEHKITYENILNQYSAITNINFNLQGLICKRLGTIHLMNKQLDLACKQFMQAQTYSADDYEVHMSLGMILYLQNKFTEAIERFQIAFNLCQTNYHLNQIIMFTLNKIGLRDKALEFAMNIYKLPQFSNVFWLSFTIGQYLMSKGQFIRAHEILQKAVDQFQFNSDKTYKFYYEKKLDFGDISIPYFINQNDNVFLSDYPVFSSQFYECNQMGILTEIYFQQDRHLKQFRLEMKLAEIKKLLGLQGSALKSIEKAESLLLSAGKGDAMIGKLDDYLHKDIGIGQTDMVVRIVEFTRCLNSIQIDSKWVSTSQQKRIDLRFAKQLILLNYEAAQLHLFGQNEYYAQERMIQGTLCAIHQLLVSPDDQEVHVLVNSYLPFVFEIGLQLIKHQYNHYSQDIALELANKYHQLFTIVSGVIQYNTYVNECLREFFYMLGLIGDSKYYKDSLQYTHAILNQLCGVKLEHIQNMNEVYQDMRHSLQGQDKKMLIVRNSLNSLIQTTIQLKGDCKQYLSLSISLFPKCEQFYYLASLIELDDSIRIGYLLKSLECNPGYQLSLNALGLYLIKQQNYDYAQQVFLKSIESDPTTSSFSYLALSIIGLIYLQQNYQLELPNVNVALQFDALEQHQNQIRNQVESYINYVATLQNSPFLNIVSLIFRSLYMGASTISESLLYNDTVKPFLLRIPKEYHSILNVELEGIFKSTNEQQLESLLTVDALLKESTTIRNIMNQCRNHLRWAKLLKYLLHLSCLIIDKSDDINIIRIHTKDILQFIRDNVASNIRQAATAYNFDILMFTLIEKWYHVTRNHYLIDAKHKDQYLEVARIKQNCQNILNAQLKYQIINSIDLILTNTEQSITQELVHKLSFMECVQAADMKGAKQHLQQCILNNPTQPIYRQILAQLNYQPYSHKVQLDLLGMSKSNQSLNWLSIIIQETQLLELHSDRVDKIRRIIQFKILPYCNKEIASQVLIVLYDCINFTQDQQLIQLSQQIQQQFNIKSKYEILATILQQISNKQYQDANTNILKYKIQHLDQYEDYMASKKGVTFLLPILMSLYQNNINVIQLAQDALQHSLYAQQTLTNDIQLNRCRYMISSIIYIQLLRQLDNNDTIADTLIQLKDVADEFLSQGTYNHNSISMYIHYTIATEKVVEMREWLKQTAGYLRNWDGVIAWGMIMDLYNDVLEKKTLESLRRFVKEIEKLLPNNSKLRALSYFLVGQAMMNVNDWQQQFLKEDVLKKFQLACLTYPGQAIEISKYLQPLQAPRKRKEKKLRLEAILKEDEQDQKQEQQQQQQSKNQDGLNSDSDDELVERMDYDDDIQEFQKQHGLTYNEHDMLVQQEQQQQYFDQQAYEQQIYQQQLYQQQQTLEHQPNDIQEVQQIEQYQTFEEQVQQMRLDGYSEEQINAYFYPEY